MVVVSARTRAVKMRARFRLCEKTIFVLIELILSNDNFGVWRLIAGPTFSKGGLGESEA